MELDSRQLTALGLIVAMTGAGGTLLARQGTTTPPAPSPHVAVLREQIDRLERRTERRHDLLMRRVRELEKWGS